MTYLEHGLGMYSEKDGCYFYSVTMSDYEVTMTDIEDENSIYIMPITVFIIAVDAGVFTKEVV